MPPTASNPPCKRRRILRATTIATLLVIAAYIAAAVHLVLDEPTVTRDYYAEHNAAHAGLSEDQKAWSTYHAARDAWNDLARPITQSVMALAQEDDNKQRDLEAADPHYDRPPSPYENEDNPCGLPTDHPLYADALDALEAFQPNLAEIRHAATLPAIGIPLTDRWRNNLAWTPGEELEPSVNPFDRPPLIIQSMQKVANFGFAHLFAFDSIAATGPVAPQRIIDNTRTLIHIARQ